jgi:hypothetical protein
MVWQNAIERLDPQGKPSIYRLLLSPGAKPHAMLAQRRGRQTIQEVSG